MVANRPDSLQGSNPGSLSPQEEGGSNAAERQATPTIRAEEAMNLTQLRKNFEDMKKAMYTQHETVSLREMIGEVIAYLEAKEKSARPAKLPQKTK